MADASSFRRPNRLTDLDRIEALTDWCRLNIEPPPAGLLYAAAGAVANLRHKAMAEMEPA